VKTKIVQFRIEESLFEELKNICEDRKITLSSLIRFILSSYIKKQKTTYED